ncbi:MAG: nickel pincer cofactor biosynthesis protein LarC, partial [bacterium]
DWRLSAERTVKRGVSATQFLVDAPQPAGGTGGAVGEGESHGHANGLGRSLSGIERLLREAPLPPRPRERALAAFRRLGKVEAEIHDVPIERIHFHEMGAVDSIVDITGYFIALELLGIERVISSPLPVGRGFTASAHGRIPIPAPATARLLEGVPILDNGMEGEVLTPTGALLLSESAESFGPMPSMTVTAVGHGSGRMDQPIPNIVRAFLGESEESKSTPAPGTIAVLETNIDDMSGEIFPYVIEGALALGALDAFAIPSVGKKGRPASLLTILCPLELQDELTRYLFRETTTLGVRYRSAERAVAERDWAEVDTPWGRVRVKRARYRGETVNIAPEFEDCRKLAESAGVPLKEVLAAAAAAGKAALDSGIWKK